MVENEHESLKGEEPIQHAPFFNADFKDDKSCPFIASKRCVPRHQVHAREAPRGHQTPAPTAAAPPRHGGHARASCPCAPRRATGASSSAVWRRIRRAHVARRPPVLRRARGIGPAPAAAVSRPRTTASTSSASTLPVGPKQGVRRRAAGRDARRRRPSWTERAARIKARIDTINSTDGMVSARNLDADVGPVPRGDGGQGARVHGARRAHHQLQRVRARPRQGRADDDLLHMFLLRYYDATTSIPHEVILRDEPEDKAAMEAWLTEKLASPYGAKVRITAPQKGEKAELVGMAETNAKHTLMRYKVRTNYDDKRINNALLQLESALALDEPPMRIECFDISTIHGSYTVASMVVFTGGKPDKNQY
ncbi:MAG: excinuclease ABC subunit UvrC, partial [Eggerthella lenta]